MSMITRRSTLFVRLFLAALLTGSEIIRVAEGVRCYACTNLPSSTSELCNGNDTDHPTNEIIKDCNTGCLEKFRRSPNSTQAIFSRGCSGEGRPYKCMYVEGCSDLSTDIRHTCSCGTNKCNKNLQCFTGTRDGKSTANSEVTSSSVFTIIMIGLAAKMDLLHLLLLIFTTLIISSAEGVRCYVCPNPGSMSKTCVFNDTVADPINEIVEECANGCFETFQKGANSTFARGCERHYAPLKCWDVDGCSDLETDTKHTCSCGTNLCNKNLPCFTGEKDPPTTTPSSGNSVMMIAFPISSFIIFMILFRK